MPYNGDIYSPPAGTKGAPKTTIQSAKYNTFLDDITQAQNTPRPIVGGGTGANTLSGAKIALGVDKVVKYGEAQTLTEVDKRQAIANIGAGALAGLRNKIINPTGIINQRGVSGTVVLAAGVYGHDMLKAGASGCTYTFTTSNGVTTFSISAGSMLQVIEASSFAGAPGEYVLGWSGSAQGRINAGSYGASGAVKTSLNGSANVSVEWGVGTVSLMQLEKDFLAEFSARHVQQELAMCQRFHERSNGSVVWVQPGNSGAALQRHTVPFKVDKRATPTVTRANVAGDVTVESASSTHFNVSGNGPALQFNNFSWIADAGL